MMLIRPPLPDVTLNTYLHPTLMCVLQLLL